MKSFEERKRSYLEPDEQAPRRGGRRNRNFLLFVVMLAMMIMMATLASRQFQRNMVEVVIDYENSGEGKSAFTVYNLADGGVWFTKRYELLRILPGGGSAVVDYADVDGVFYISEGGAHSFLYEIREMVPRLFSAELAPGVYSITKLYTFTDGSRELVVSIHGDMFFVESSDE